MELSFENPEKNKSPQNEVQKKIQKLEKDDNSTEVAEELAYKENEFRKDLEEKGMPKENISEMADKISDETLEKLGLKKETREVREKLEETEKKALRDGLTGLRNRRDLDENGIEILSIEKRAKSNCAILMLDLDHFKEVNDTLGHEAGDAVLKKLAQIVKNNIRTGDLAYRYGGEEFVVLLPKTDSEEAKIVAEKIRKAVEEAIIEIIDKDTKHELKKTISIGISGTDQDEEWNNNDKISDYTNVLERIQKNADDALYFSKNSGRNKTTVFGEDEKKTNYKLIKSLKNIWKKIKQKLSV